jgi:hypothetical protein
VRIAEANNICVAVIRVYEGDGYTWDFDGQGLSLGLLQWNIKQQTLQPMLRAFLATQEAKELLPVEALNSLTNMLTLPLASQMAWAKGINDYAKKDLVEPWRKVFKTIPASKAWLDIEVKATQHYLDIARAETKWSGVKTCRAYVMFFDMAVQNGGMGSVLKLALSAAKPLLGGMVKDGKAKNTDADKAWLIACAGTRAIVAYLSNPAFAMNAFKRRLGILEGGYNWRKGELPQVNAEVNFEAAKYGVSDEILEDL